MDNLNERLKGWRTQIAVFIGMAASTLETLQGFIMSLGDILGAQLGQGGSATILVGAVVALKALVTDTLPKLKGNLDRTNPDHESLQ